MFEDFFTFRQSTSEEKNSIILFMVRFLFFSGSAPTWKCSLNAMKNVVIICYTLLDVMKVKNSTGSPAYENSHILFRQWKNTGRVRRSRRRQLLLWYCESVRWTIESLRELCVSLLCSTEIVIKFTILWRLMIRMAKIVILPPYFHSISLPVDLLSVLQIEWNNKTFVSHSHCMLTHSSPRVVCSLSFLNLFVESFRGDENNKKKKKMGKEKIVVSSKWRWYVMKFTVELSWDKQEMNEKG